MTIQASYTPKFKQWFWRILFLLISVPVLYSTISLWITGGLSWMLFFQALIPVSFPLTLAVRMLTRVYPMMNTKILTTANSIQLIRGNHLDEVDWDQIIKVDRSWWPLKLGGGLNLTLKSGQIVFLPAFLSPYADLVEEIAKRTLSSTAHRVSRELFFVPQFRRDLLFLYLSHVSIFLVYLPIFIVGFLQLWPDTSLLVAFCLSGPILLYLCRMLIEKFEILLSEPQKEESRPFVLFVTRSLVLALYYAALIGFSALLLALKAYALSMNYYAIK